MTKTQLVDAVQTRTGFGTFSVAERGARTGKHPRTGEPMEIAATRVPKFAAASGLKQAVR